MSEQFPIPGSLEDAVSKGVDGAKYLEAEAQMRHEEYV
jgi:hypothetical protein